jgi:CheY-specific phosphatase CheX
MFSQYFGHYLLNHELITREQLADVLEYQKSVHVKFGVIAVDEDFMTSSQVEEVHEKQKQVDKRFGEIAIELGYLSDDQVEALISKQKQKHLFLAQALVDRGYMTIEQFSQSLNQYKKENSLSDAQFEELKSGSIDALVENILVDDQKSIYGKYVTLFAKNVIRFIDDQVHLEVSNADVAQQDKWLVHQEILGESPLFTAITANEEVFLHIASKHAEEELTEVDELAKASVSEFLNLTNGIYLVNMSNWGVELNMKPQSINENVKVSGELTCIKVQTSFGSFQLLLSNQPNSISIVSSGSELLV